MVSKLNADRKAGEGAGQAIGRIYKNIGFKGLWNGYVVCSTNLRVRVNADRGLTGYPFASE
jgi:hypothetical protein